MFDGLSTSIADGPNGLSLHQHACKITERPFAMRTKLWRKNQALCYASVARYELSKGLQPPRSRAGSPYGASQNGDSGPRMEIWNDVDYR